jgi:uncharacterized membrane protein
MREVSIYQQRIQNVLSQWWAAFDIGGDTQRRITLIGLAIAMQGIIELPREILSLITGEFVGVIDIVILAASLGILGYAVIAPPSALASNKLVLTQNGWRKAVLICTLGIALTVGARQIIIMAHDSFALSSYPNDGTTIDHYAAILLLRGQDPYQTLNIVDAVRALHQSGEFTTPLRAGLFADRSWLEYPPKNVRIATMANVPSGVVPPEYETKVSYPALSFLILVPFVAIGLPSVILSTVLAYIFMSIVSLRAVAPDARPWVVLLLIADVPIIEGVAIGSLDIIVMVSVLLMWLWWKRPVASTLMLGLALTTKQQAWFFAIFFGIFLAQRLGWSATAKRFGGAAAIFLVVNAPFMLHDFHAWLAGISAPQSDPMFPMGEGLVGLATTKIYGIHLMPLLPQSTYSLLSLIAFGLALWWYMRIGSRRYPVMGIGLAMAPLWFNWRSLPSYFYFCALPMLILWLAWQRVPDAMTLPRHTAPALTLTEE